MHAAQGSAVVLFDGVCNLCNASVQFIIRRDPHARFRFAALQSDAAQALLRSIGARESQPDSVMLIEDRSVFTRSAAALRTARRLRFPWPLLYAFIIVPRPLRDWAYDVIARNRYRWFGKREACMIPTPDVQNRFLPPECAGITAHNAAMLTYDQAGVPGGPRTNR